MKQEKSGYLFWALLAVLGILLIVWNRAVQTTLCVIFALGLILVGGLGVYGWWKAKKRAPQALVDVAGSAVFVLVGLWILFRPARFIDLLNIVLGGILVVSSLLTLARVWKQRSWLPIALACVGVVLGLIIIFYNAATALSVIWEGLALVYAGVSGAIGEWQRNK